MQFVELWRRRKGVPTKAEVQNRRWPKQLEGEREMQRWGSLLVC